MDCDLEKISKKLKFGIDVPYTFRTHQKKSPPIVPWEQPKFIMADFSQNVLILRNISVSNLNFQFGMCVRRGFAINIIWHLPKLKLSHKSNYFCSLLTKLPSKLGSCKVSLLLIYALCTYYVPCQTRL